MFRFYFLLGIFALVSFADELDEQITKSTCPPIPPLAPPPPGCNYNVTTDANGCQIAWNLVCGSRQCDDPNAAPSDCGRICNCDQYRQKNGKCPLVCVDMMPGGKMPCFCKDGFVKNGSRGICIPVGECNSGANFTCPPPPPIAAPPPGCNYEFQRDSNNCITAWNLVCNKKCEDPNAERKTCGISCDCQEFQKTGGQCPQLCASFLPGPGAQLPCLCKDGHVKNSQNGQCIPVADCKKNSNFTCHSPLPFPPGVPPVGCNYNITYDENGCQRAWNLVCNSNFGFEFSNDSSAEFSDLQLLKKCSKENESFTFMCGCEKSCKNLGENLLCPKICRRNCFCNEGFLRDENQNCVLESECPKDEENSKDLESKEKICRLPSATGACRAAIPQFFYNSVSQKCEEFIFGGCGGNGNKFNSEDECLKFCGGIGQCPNGTSIVKCFVDPCRFSKCASNPSAKCVSDFCDGCKAKFFDVDGKELTNFQCQNETISEIPNDQKKKRNITCPFSVPLPEAPEGCNFNFTYDEDGCQTAWNFVCQNETFSTQCEKENEEFKFLCGCEGSCQTLGKLVKCPGICRRNCFCKSGFVRDANRTCVPESECPKDEGNKEPICRLPSAPGICRAAIPRFFYDSASQKCQKFLYGGCGGNENNFKSAAECQKFCAGISQCQNGTLAVNCLVDPCQTAKCPSNPSAKCVSDYCDGCNARFFDANGREIQCHIEKDEKNEIKSAPGSCAAANIHMICPTGEICRMTSEGPQCLATDEKFPTDPCANQNCGECEICVAEPKKCVAAPCPQFRCEKDPECSNSNRNRTSFRPCNLMCVQGMMCRQTPNGPECVGDPCLKNSCGSCEKCVPEFRESPGGEPCPQFRCEPDPECQPETEGEKPGQCPVGIQWNNMLKCQDRCQRDGDCPETQKCCATSCGKFCRLPKKISGSD